MSDAADAIKVVSGKAPTLVWKHDMSAPITALAQARECGDLFCADQGGDLWRIGPAGEIANVQRIHEPLRNLAWSDDGRRGVGCLRENQICWINRELEIRETLQLPDSIMSLTMDPYGEYVAAGLADGSLLLFDGPRQPIQVIPVHRPLNKVLFLTTVPELIGMAAQGTISRYSFRGKELWQVNTFSAIGDVCADGAGEACFVAAFNLGLQRYDRQGENEGTYQLDGTVLKASCSHDGQQIVVSTQEGRVHWLSGTGETVWIAKCREPVAMLVCDPWGQGGVLALASGTVLRLNCL